MDTTISREDFHRWLESRDCNPVAWLKDAYLEVWKASRESIVVELPAKANMDSCFDGINYANSSGRNRAIDDCAAVLRSAGLTVKGD